MKFYHLRLVSASPYCYGYGGLTLVVDHSHQPPIFGYALCNPNDQFSRKKGRDIALDCLKKKPLTLPRGLFACEVTSCAVARVLEENKGLRWLEKYYLAQPWHKWSDAYANGRM